MKKLLIALSCLSLLFACTSTSEEALTVDYGDVVNIDYVGTFNGELFDGGSYEGYDLEIGSQTFIDDFEDQLVGMEEGETKTITVTFPDYYPYSTELEGQDVQFEVTINTITRNE